MPDGKKKDDKKEDGDKKEFPDDDKVPPGSWVAHNNGGGPPFWRSNLTGEMTHALFIVQSEGSQDPVRQYIPMKKEEAKTDKPKDKPKGDTTKGPTVVGAPKWEELYDKITGKKSWKGKDNKIVHEDPYE